MSEAEGRGFYMTQLCTIYEDEKLKAGVFEGLKIKVTQYKFDSISYSGATNVYGRLPQQNMWHKNNEDF